MQKYSLFCYYEIEGKRYNVYIKYKGLRSNRITYYFKNDAFYISSPNFASKALIMSGLEKNARTLIRRSVLKRKEYDGHGIYILGEYVPINEGFVNCLGKSFLFIDLNNFYEKVAPLFQKMLESRVRYYESLMKINEPYKVKVRLKSSNYGVNSRRTHTLTFTTTLIHYSLELIDAIVVHELAHHFVFNHSSDFYDVVYEYMPDYDYRIYKVKKSIFK